MEPIGNRELPEEFVKKMRRLLSGEASDFFESYGRERSLGLRLNPLKTRADGMQKGGREDPEGGPAARERFGLRKIPWTGEGYYYDASLRPGKHPYHEAGLYYIQEPSAMAAAEILKPEPGERILDLCAAPGGKSTHIAGKMGGRGLLVCNEIYPSRAKILSQNVERMGIGNAVVTNEEPGRLAVFFPEFFDGIAVDAPCSGEGMFRKDEDAVLEWSADRVALCAIRQEEILESAAAMTRAGGRIVYSTCTFSPEENEGAVLRFLKKHPEFFAERPEAARFFSEGRPDWVPEGEGPAALRKELEKTVRIWPHKVEGEGHFLALLRKDGPRERTEDGDQAGQNGRSGKRENRGRGFAGEKESRGAVEEFELFRREEIPNRRPPGYVGRPILFGEQLYLLPEGVPGIDGLRVLRPGLHLGAMRKGRFEPSHALALSLSEAEVGRWADVGSGGLAERFLRGEALPAALAKRSALGLNGWTLITADGYSLGWAKLSGGVLKNHYPKGLRRM